MSLQDQNINSIKKHSESITRNLKDKQNELAKIDALLSMKKGSVEDLSSTLDKLNEKISFLK